MMEAGSNGSSVTILGAGIVGICSALELQEKGYSVEIIDRNEPGHGTSFGNAGVVSPWSCVPQSMPGIWKSIPRWLIDPYGPLKVRYREIPKLLPWITAFFANTRLDKVHKISSAMDMLMKGNIGAYRGYLKNTGRENLLRDSYFINVFRGQDKPNLEDLNWQLRIERGAPVEIVGRNELNELEPELSDEIETAVLVKQQARVCEPAELCKTLTEKAIAQNAKFTRCDVRQLYPTADNKIEIHASGGVSNVNKLLICAGIWSLDLLKPLGINLPLVSERGYHLEFIDPGVRLNHSVLDVAGKFIISSMKDRIRSAGTSEFADFRAPPNYQRADMLAPLTKRLIPRLDCQNTRRWVGARPSFPDNLPAIGILPGFDNIYCAFGHSHYGLGMAPATARIIASCINGEPSPENLSDVSVNRFL